MLRTFSTRPSHHGYQELLDGYDTSSFDSHGYHGNLSRLASVSGKIFSPSRKFPPEKIIESPSSNHSDKHAKNASKVHPIFALFGSAKILKKATARPEFQRYINYLKDGGILADAK